MKRRSFVRTGLLAGVGMSLACRSGEDSPAIPAARAAPGSPRVISTWDFGLAANAVALGILERGGTPLDAAERGVMVPEGDPEVQSVGYGGLPNVEGVVELDAAIMDGDRLEAGSVASVQGIKHPIAVARKVMDETPHVLLVGDGARRYAIEQGFPIEDLLTPEAKERWEREGRVGRAAAAGHDTIGMVTLAADGRMAAACTTSGLGWKMPGRVGDSPLIGHGLYCDSKAGGAAATGVGEEVIKVCGSYQVVEFMRQGIEPDEAVRRVIERIVARNPANRAELIAFVALRADGEYGYASTIEGYSVAISGGGRHEVVKGPNLY